MKPDKKAPLKGGSAPIMDSADTPVPNILRRRTYMDYTPDSSDVQAAADQARTMLPSGTIFGVRTMAPVFDSLGYRVDDGFVEWRAPPYQDGTLGLVGNGFVVP